MAGTDDLLTDTIALDRYPVQDLSEPTAKSLVANCVKQLSENGLCLLPGFITDTALQEIQRDARGLIKHAHYTEHWRATPNGDAETPASRLHTTTRASMRSIAYDYLDAGSRLRALYSWDRFTAFINAIFDGPELYITADPLVGCMLTSMTAGDELGWHYDPNDIVVSLSVQEPLAGGEFEFAPRIRHPQPNAQANEKAVLAVSYPGVIRKALKPGTLSLFNGHHSLHRVSPVAGARERIVALFNYSEVPYYRFSDEIHKQFFGRTAQEELH